jgi:hypothetical protein
MSADFDREQREIIDQVDNLLRPCKGKGKEGQRWGKFKGDVVCRIIRHHVQTYLPISRKIVGPSVYVAGFEFPSEFDLAIVDREAEPRQHTNAYNGEQIRYILEIKMSGPIGKGGKYEEMIRKQITIPFNNVKAKYLHIRPVYLAVRQTIKPRKEGSICFAKKTENALAPYPAFILQDIRGRVIQYGKWQAFIEYLTEG